MRRHRHAGAIASEAPAVNRPGAADDLAIREVCVAMRTAGIQGRRDRGHHEKIARACPPKVRAIGRVETASTARRDRSNRGAGWSALGCIDRLTGPTGCPYITCRSRRDENFARLRRWPRRLLPGCHAVLHFGPFWPCCSSTRSASPHLWRLARHVLWYLCAQCAELAVVREGLPLAARIDGCSNAIPLACCIGRRFRR